MTQDPSAQSPLAGRMIFVVGARRSGTNWLQRVLGAHPDVAVVPSETHLFSHGIAPLAERFSHGAIGSSKTATVYLARGEFIEASRHLCDRVFGGLLAALGPDARYLVERTPWHVHHLDLIGEVYPDAPVLHIVRDGRDVVRSLMAQNWPESGPRSVEEAAAEWRSAITDARRAAPRLTRYREVRYEELLADPRAGIEDIYGWLGLILDEVSTAEGLAAAGVRFNVDASMPVVAAGKWRGGLSADALRSFNAVAGDTLVELGYALEEPAPDEPRRRRTGAAYAGARVRAARFLRRVRPVEVAPAARVPDPAAVESLLHVFDQLVACLGEADHQRVRDLVAPEVQISATVAGERWQGRGEAGVERLVAAVEADDVIRGRQLRGDIHVGVGMFTAVLAYETPTGATLDVTIVAHVSPVGVTHLTYYRWLTAEGR